MKNTQQHQDMVARARASLISGLAYLDLCDVLGVTGMILPDGTTIDNRTPEERLVETVKANPENNSNTINKDVMEAIKIMTVDDFLTTAKECKDIGYAATNHEKSPGVDGDLLASLIHDDACSHTANKQVIQEISPEFFED